MTPPARPRFTLMAVATLDGFIARAPGHTPAEWASGEEQALFFDAVEAADWAVLGRVTHEAAFRPTRRRIVLSGGAPLREWRAPTHLWLDPAGLTPDALASLVQDHRPMREALILGGTRVHDWFHAHGRIDAVALTVEPLRFGRGLPLFSGQTERDPVAAFVGRGYALLDERPLNRIGTRLATLAPRR